MTVNSEVTRVSKFPGAGGTGPYTGSWPLLATTDLTVTKVVDATGVRTTLATPADYSASLVALGLSGWSITTVAAVAVGETLVVEGNTARTQLVKYSNQGDFFPETHEKSYDRLTYAVQELNGRQDRSLQLIPETTVTGAVYIDEPTANAYLQWDSTGTKVTNSTVVNRINENEQSDNYTLVLTDENKLISLTGATAKTFTIPPNSSVAFPIGAQVFFLQKGTGELDIAAGSGVTITSEFSWKTLNTQYSFATAIKIDTNTWQLIGSLKA